MLRMADTALLARNEYILKKMCCKMEDISPLRDRGEKEMKRLFIVLLLCIGSVMYGAEWTDDGEHCVLNFDTNKLTWFGIEFNVSHETVDDTWCSLTLYYEWFEAGKGVLSLSEDMETIEADINVTGTVDIFKLHKK